MINHENIKNLSEILNLIKETIRDNNIKVDTTNIHTVSLRKNGKFFSFNEHIEGLILSLLSKQRPWKQIFDNRDDIKKIFFDFDKEKILSKKGSYFEDELRKIACGNRSIKQQMQILNENIKLLEKIKSDYKSLDNFLLSDSPKVIANKLSSPSSSYKLKQVGLALALEYMRNVGIDAPKPDVHLCRIISASRLNFINRDMPTEKETLDVIEEMNKISNYSQVEIDSLLWHFCAEDFCNICNSTPKCVKCKIKQFCIRGK